MSIYENHLFDFDLPIIFHLDHIESCGISNYHENIEILYCVNGKGKVYINSTPVDMEKDSIIMINSGDIHYSLADTQDFTYYCLIIYSNFLKKFGINVEETYFSEIVTDTVGLDFFEKIISELSMKRAYYKAVVTGEIVSYMAYLCRVHTQIRKQYKNDAIIKEGLIYIRNNFKKEISVEQVASHVGFSRFYFSRKFKHVTGMTLTEYIQFLRCRHTREMLLEGSSVSKAATECGFSDISYFTKVFKRQVGLLPSEVLTEQNRRNNKG